MSGGAALQVSPSRWIPIMDGVSVAILSRGPDRIGTVTYATLRVEETGFETPCYWTGWRGDVPDAGIEDRDAPDAVWTAFLRFVERAEARVWNRSHGDTAHEMRIVEATDVNEY